MVAPARAFKTDDELSAIPLNEGVVIELPDGVTAPESDGDPEPKIEKKVDPQPKQDDPVEALRTQLKASEDARQRAERDATEARRVAEERAGKLADAERRTSDSEADAVASGLAAAQSEEKAARAALKSAIETGDADAQGEAAARIGRAASDIREFERAAATLDAQKQERDRQPAPPPRNDPVDINTAIDRMQLLPAERDWLKAHPDALMDKGRNTELEAAYIRSTRKGLVRGTPDYFKFLEAEMGYAAAPAATTQEITDVQAAPSRNDRDVSGRPTNGRITLTPEERDIARSMGVSEIEYARQKVAFEAARKADPEKYAAR